MKKVGLYLIFTFSIYLIGQLIWILTILFDEPLFGSKFLELMLLINIYTLSAIFGLLSGILLYKSATCPVEELDEKNNIFINDPS